MMSRNFTIGVCFNTRRTSINEADPWKKGYKCFEWFKVEQKMRRGMKKKILYEGHRVEFVMNLLTQGGAIGEGIYYFFYISRQEYLTISCINLYSCLRKQITCSYLSVCVCGGVISLYVYQ